MAHPLEAKIGYTFKNPGLLTTALTHTSYANESRVPVAHNERLEFLGTASCRLSRPTTCSTPTQTAPKAI